MIVSALTASLQSCTHVAHFYATVQGSSAAIDVNDTACFVDDTMTVWQSLTGHIPIGPSMTGNDSRGRFRAESMSEDL